MNKPSQLRCRRRSHQPPFSFSLLATSFHFYLTAVWAHCSLVGIVYHFGKTTGIVHLYSIHNCLWLSGCVRCVRGHRRRRCACVIDINRPRSLAAAGRAGRNSARRTSDPPPRYVRNCHTPPPCLSAQPSQDDTLLFVGFPRYVFVPRPTRNLHLFWVCPPFFPFLLAVNSLQRRRGIKNISFSSESQNGCTAYISRYSMQYASPSSSPVNRIKTKLKRKRHRNPGSELLHPHLKESIA